MIQELGTLPIQLFGSDELKQRFLPKCASGEWSPAFALSEPDAGSDPASMRTHAVQDGDEWVLNGEKWFVTGPDNTDFMIVQAMVVEAGDPQPTLFLVDYDTPGVRMSADPAYMHTYADRHPQFVLEDVRVPDAARLGAIGAADDLSNEWFVAERIHIGARCAGAMERLLTLAVEWARTAAEVSSRGDYSLRAKRTTDDELGTLVMPTALYARWTFAIPSSASAGSVTTVAPSTDSGASSSPRSSLAASSRSRSAAPAAARAG